MILQTKWLSRSGCSGLFANLRIGLRIVRSKINLDIKTRQFLLYYTNFLKLNHALSWNLTFKKRVTKTTKNRKLLILYIISKKTLDEFWCICMAGHSERATSIWLFKSKHSDTKALQKQVIDVGLVSLLLFWIGINYLM